MKLLKKINRRYLFFSIIVLVFFGVAINYVIAFLFAEELDEKLIDTQARIQRLIEEGNDIPALEPFINVQELPGGTEGAFFLNTLIEDPVDKELEEYRQLTVVKEINGEVYQIVVRESQLETADMLENIGIVTVLALLVMISALFFINKYIARSVWLPFNENLKLMQKFSVNDLSPLKLKHTGISEFDNLNKILTSLTEKVVSDYKALKQFSEDAAHELQTPLATIRAKLESLINSNKLTSKQAEIIQSVYSSVDRLTKLNKSLILLTKIENRQFTDVVKIDMKAFIQNKLIEFEELIELKNLQVKSSFARETTIEMSQILADILINNLISNAINHNTTGGGIAIELLDKELSICNSGERRLAAPEKIFARFFKDNPSSKSIGLGLAIVKKICDTQRFQIEYSFSEKKHCFRLTF